MASIVYLLALCGTVCLSLVIDESNARDRRALSDSDMTELTNEYHLVSEQHLLVKVSSTWVSMNNVGIDPEASAYFLVLNNVCAAWTKFNRDRIMLWHGGRADVDIIDPKGGLVTKCLGDSLKDKGCRYIVTVPAYHKSAVMPVSHLYFSDVIVKGTAQSSGRVIPYKDMMKNYPQHSSTIMNTKMCYKNTR